MVVAINIQTDLWNKVIDLLARDNWVTIYKYDGFDAGIDYDFMVMIKDKEEILFGWDNWFEGEIKCTEARMKEIEKLVGQEFEKGEPTNLKPESIQAYKDVDGLWTSIKRLFN